MLKEKDKTELVFLAYCLIKGGYPKENLFKRICKSIKFASPDSKPKEVESLANDICELAIDGNTSISWSHEVEEWIGGTSGYFSLQQCYHELHAIDAKDKTAIRVAILRFCDKGVLEKDEKVNGRYRKVNKELNVINWWEADDDVLPIQLPFDLHDKVNIPRKSIIMVAGVSNQGKSGFTLEVAEKNCEAFKIRYCASEWSPSNLRRRLKNFKFREDKARQVEFISRSRNFGDVIEPDGLNIIDFLEIHDEAWKVSGQIEAIFDKLNEGIAIILLQKSPGSTFGKGGHGTIEKAALAVTLDNKILQINKLKDPVEEECNIDGLACNYEFGNGGRLIKASGWGKVVKEKRAGQEIVTIEQQIWANSRKKEDRFAWDK